MFYSASCREGPVGPHRPMSRWRGWGGWRCTAWQRALKAHACVLSRHTHMRTHTDVYSHGTHACVCSEGTHARVLSQGTHIRLCSEGTHLC